MLESRATIGPYWDEPLPDDEHLARQVEHGREEHLMLDARPPAELNQLTLARMRQTGPRFWIALAGLGALTLAFFIAWAIQIVSGLGITGLNRSVMWGPYIANLIYFIGIGHAGTFISAALRLMRMDFRRPIARAAETITLFGLACAALFPIIHVGRIWKLFYMLPIPNQRDLWPNFRSALFWDMMAITTYLIGSTLFMYVALIPDLAMARDHMTGWRRKLYSALSLGWRGTEGEWHRLEVVSNLLSFVIIPVMFSVHTGVSWNLSMAIQPGWHSAIFGPFFVVGALYSGVAAVILVMIIVRKTMRFGYFMREEHFNAMGIFLLILTLTWIYFYFAEWITNWYGNLPLEKAVQAMLTGPLAPLFYLMLFCNIVVPLGTLWSRRVRTSLPAMLVIGILIQVGMYIERVLIVSGSLSRNELPFNWVNYTPHWPEVTVTLGTLAFLGLLYMVYTRFVPIIPVWEVYEGQAMQGSRRVGRAVMSTRTEVH
ncbi:MAG: polysulfide reductase NrfD [Anaerolineae bacterium]|nr:polysulfide reductase NrfD [Anaerolineae bacterium]MEB2286618.1 polysulfide reductase NrfD [Anaerolineae bacterium]